MNQTVLFYFDVGSPTAYLASTQLPAVCDKHGATLEYRPMLLGGVFKATGNQSPVALPAKGKWMLDDLNRWADLYDVPLSFNPHFPINTLFLMRALTGMLMREPERFEGFLTAVFKGLWVDSCDFNDPEATATYLNAAGFDAQALMQLAADDAVKERLKATTAEAVEKGVFGAPSMFVGEQLFFGQDRVFMVGHALQAGR